MSRNILVGLTWITAFICFTVLVLNDYPWWGLVALVFAAFAKMHDPPFDERTV
jgi:hypothetical protein